MSIRKEIYFAGGCFWGMEKLFQQLPGVLETTCGYANGDESIHPDYPRVCQGDTGYKETVHVIYDDAQITLDQLLTAYFYVVDPTVENRQGNDIGTQYQTGIYYVDDEDENKITSYIQNIKDNFSAFCVEVLPLSSFVAAEEYHQDYLIKNPTGYCHIPNIKYQQVVEVINNKHKNIEK